MMTRIHADDIIFIRAGFAYIELALIHIHTWLTSRMFVFDASSFVVCAIPAKMGVRMCGKKREQKNGVKMSIVIIKYMQIRFQIKVD